MEKKSKYDIFLDELVSLEKLIYKYIQKLTELTEFNRALQKKINQFDKENEILKLKIKELETIKGGNSFPKNFESELEKLSADEKKGLSIEISNLINRIDHHLRSDN